MRNKILGSALMIAGTTIGAGMLAMPLTSAGIGLGMTTLLLVGLWLLLGYTGLLFMEVYQTAKQQDVGVATLAEQYFGMTGRVLATASLLILLYALLSAYLTGGASLLIDFLPENTWQQDTKLTVSSLILTLVLGAVVSVGVKGVDGLTRLLFAFKIAVFVILLFTMLPKVQPENLLATPVDNLQVVSAVPIFFTAFGFHVIMASINTYLDADIKKIRMAVYIGTLIPLVAYLLWQLATHGVLSQTEFMAILAQDPTLNGLVRATSHITGSTMLGEVMRLFSALAILTSFLGVAMGIFECVNDFLKFLNFVPNRFVIALFTFLPPLVFTLFYPDGFIMVLGYAGLLFAFYGVILPVGLAWKARQQHPNLAYRVAGGNVALWLVLAAGIAIMLIPSLIQMGYLPQVVS